MIDPELNITGKLCEFKYRYERLARIRQIPEEDEADLFTNSVIRHSLFDKRVVRLPRLTRKKSSSFMY